MWVQAVYLVIVTLLSMYLASKVKAEEPEPINAEDFSLPDNSQDREIPLIYGTVKLTGFNVIGVGDYGSFEIKKKVKGGMFGGSKKQTVGFGYRLGLINAFGWGGLNKEIQLMQFLADDNLLYTATATGSFSATVDNKSLFGPYVEGEGGMSGNFSFYNGAETQVIDPYAASITDGKASQWRNLSYLVWKGGYIGNSGSLAAWQFIVKRIIKPAGFNAAIADVNGGANAAYVLYDILTDKNYGAGLSESSIDLVNFAAVAQTLYNEGWGLNMNLNEKGKLSDLITQITSKIDGSLNMNRTTGKYYIKLIRQDYVVDDLLTLDESIIVSISNYSKNNFASMTNQIKVSYTNKNNNFQKEQVVFKDSGLTYEMSTTETTELDYSILTDADLAYRVAIREIIPLSTPLFKCELTTNRFTSNLDIGDCVVLSLKKYKIERIVMRITEIDYGSISEPEMSISLMQDKFGFAYDVYNRVTPPAPPFNDFTALPMDMTVVEAPYYFTDPTDINSKLLGFGQKPSSTHINFSLTTKSSTDADFIEADDVVDFCPAANLFSDINEQATSIFTTSGIDMTTINNETDDDILNGDNLSIIIEGTKQEYVAFRSISTNANGYSLTNVRRGLLDSIPQNFTSAAKIYFINYGFQLNRGSFSGTIQARAISRTPKTELVNPTIYSLTGTNRKNRPLAPNNLTVNSLAFTSVMTIPSANIILRYNSRDKQNIVQFYNTTLTTNANNVTYRIRFYNPATGLLVKSVDTQAFTYTFDDELALNGGVRFPQLRLEVDCIDPTSLASTYKYVIILNR